MELEMEKDDTFDEEGVKKDLLEDFTLINCILGKVSTTLRGTGAGR